MIPLDARRPAVGLSLLLSGLVLSRLLFHYMLPIYDDAFITWRYSMNLIEHGVYTYNLDDVVLGTTTPLFGLFVAMGSLVLGPPESWVPLFNIGVDCVLVLLVHRAVFHGDLRMTVLFTLLLAASPVAGRITVGGMEANVFAVLSLCAIWLAAEARAVPAAVLAALSVFVRPEGVLTALVGFVAVAIERPLRLLPYTVVGLLIGALGAAVFFAVYGSVLPQSVVAKSEAIGGGMMRVIEGLVIPDVLSPVLLPLALLGLFYGRGDGRVLWLFNGWVATYLALYLVAAPLIWSWYALPVQLFLFVNAARLLVRIVDALPLLRRLPDTAAAGIAAVVMVAFLATVALNRGPDRITSEVYSTVETFCAGVTDPEATILADDIGIVGYHCRPNPIIDTAGLVWPEAAEYGHDLDIAAATRPDYIMFASFRWKVEGLVTSEIGPEYEFLYRAGRDGQSGPPLETEGLNDAWLQEYFFFARRAP